MRFPFQLDFSIWAFFSLTAVDYKVCNYTFSLFIKMVCMVLGVIFYCTCSFCFLYFHQSGGVERKKMLGESLTLPLILIIETKSSLWFISDLILKLKYCDTPIKSNHHITGFHAAFYCLLTLITAAFVTLNVTCQRNNKKANSLTGNRKGVK